VLVRPPILRPIPTTLPIKLAAGLNPQRGRRFFLISRPLPNQRRNFDLHFAGGIVAPPCAGWESIAIDASPSPILRFNVGSLCRELRSGANPANKRGDPERTYVDAIEPLPLFSPCSSRDPISVSACPVEIA
jgi:hypothetical protein